MIITKLYGGLGNQLFQYAHGLFLSHNSKHSLYVHYDYQKNCTKRVLEIQNIIENTRLVSEVSFRRVVSKIIKRNQFDKLMNKRYYYLNESPDIYFSFNPFVIKKNDHVITDGYWQNYLYSDHIKDELLSNIHFKFVRNEIINYANKLNVHTTVALHIRRGDYVSDSETNQIHGVLGLDYYTQAISHIKNEIGDLQLVAFSDDPEWCIQNLNFENILFPSLTLQTTAQEDLFLMHQCHHQIIANSSFSWWGAYLNKNPNKMVVAPKNWFNEGNWNTDGLIPPNWIRI